MKLNWSVSAFVLAMATLFAPKYLAAQSGTLDTTFGNQGIATFSFYATEMPGRISMQSDEKIVQGGGTDYAGNQGGFRVIRYNKNGIIDSTFGQMGDIFVNVNCLSLLSYIEVAPDDKIYGAGSTSTDKLGFMRLLPNGQRDSTFGTNGTIAIPQQSVKFRMRTITDMTVQSDGKVLVGGYSLDPYLSVLRLKPDGNLDSTFGLNGIATFTLDSLQDYGNTITLQTDGKILLAGKSNVAGQWGISVIRLNANGTLDNSFNETGFLYLNPGDGQDEANDIVIGSSGQIYITGVKIHGSKKSFITLKLNSDGTYDNTFGESGIAITEIAGVETGTALAEQKDGKLLMGGKTGEYEASDFTLIRYNADGTLDNTFGTAGLVITKVSNGFDYGRDLKIQNSGRILFGGGARPSSTWDYTIAAYRNDIELGMEELNSSSLCLFPNPSEGTFTIHHNLGTQANVSIHDVFGKELPFTINSIEVVEISNAPKGIYSVVVNNGKHRIVKRVVVN